MGWRFGRKSAPADARPFVPAWLQNDAAEDRFARSVEGMSLYVKVSGGRATHRLRAWEIATLRGSGVVIGGQQVVGGRAAAIASATGGTTTAFKLVQRSIKFSRRFASTA